MKRFTVIIAVFLLFAMAISARGQVLSYSCTAPVGQFHLTGQQNLYRLTGPIYVPKPGYTYAINAVGFNPSMPLTPEVEATLTLVTQRNILDLPLPPFTVVPPIWVNYSFFSATPVHKFTLNINNPFNRLDTQITCQ